jgi:hypothetical protein
LPVDVVAVGKDTLDLTASIRMIRHDPGNELLHAFHAVFDQRIVLAIRWNGVKPERVFDLALEQGPFVEGETMSLLVSDMGFLLRQPTVSGSCRPL